MARGDFGRAFAVHRRSGGTLSRKEFANKLWPHLKIQTEQNKVVEKEVEKDGEA